MKKTFRFLRLAPLSAAAVAAVLSGAARLAAQPAPSGAAAADPLRADIDPSVAPASDFFEYANGGWLKAHPIPPDESSWGIGNVVQEEIYARMRAINEAAAKAREAPGSDEQKIGDFWATGMDGARAASQGLAPLSAELSRIGAATSVRGILDAAFAELPLRTGDFFTFYVSQDDKQSGVMALQLRQGGLDLPNRDFYFKTDPNSVRVRAAYVAYVQRILALTEGAAVRPDAGERVMALETALAKASRQLAALRDPWKNYNKMSVSDLTARLTPSIDWQARLAGWGISGATTVIVGQPEFYSALEKTLDATPLPDLKDYLRFHLVSAYAEYLGGDFEKAHFDFYGRVLSGQQQERPRWKRVLDAEERAMGMVLGRVFVKQYFPESAKKRYSDMVEAVRQAFRERIEHLTWMSPETRAKALDKLTRVSKKVGYPDKWKDYSKMEIGRASYAGNVMSAARWHFADMVSKFGRPVDRTEWQMTPQTYNAYYNPSNNEIVLPAAIFTVPGLPESQVDDALAYGYVAASTIGHEITHGFDDEGRQFDADGNLHDWWSPADEKQFNERAEKIVEQFDAFEPLPGMHINGKACEGENIADLGGILIGLDAFKKTEQYRKGEKLDGFTPLQRYFLGYALGWLTHERQERLARALLSDVHAPARWRVNGPLANVPDFDEAFGVKPGDPMWRPEKDRVRIW